METIYDWVSVALFAGLIVLFMQRATSDDDAEADESIVPYLLAGVGCAVGNYLGNENYHPFAIIVLVATTAFTVHFLRPFGAYPRR